MTELTHDEARLYLQLAIDGLLKERDETALALHLDGCVACRAEALSNRSLLDLWQLRESPAPSAILTPRIMAEVSVALPARRPSVLAPLFAASGGMLLVMAWLFGGLTDSASGLLEGLLNAATMFLADPMALWNVGLDWPGASLPIAMEALLAAGLGLLLITAAGVLALPLSSPTRTAAEGAR
jgi:hypothetical protein